MARHGPRAPLDSRLANALSGNGRPRPGMPCSYRPRPVPSLHAAVSRTHRSPSATRAGVPRPDCVAPAVPGSARRISPAHSASASRDLASSLFRSAFHSSILVFIFSAYRSRSFIANSLSFCWQIPARDGRGRRAGQYACPVTPQQDDVVLHDIIAVRPRNIDGNAEAVRPASVSPRCTRIGRWQCRKGLHRSRSNIASRMESPVLKTGRDLGRHGVCPGGPLPNLGRPSAGDSTHATPKARFLDQKCASKALTRPQNTLFPFLFRTLPWSDPVVCIPKAWGTAYAATR
jgi:hypothetical protein